MNTTYIFRLVLNINCILEIVFKNTSSPWSLYCKKKEKIKTKKEKENDNWKKRAKPGMSFLKHLVESSAHQYSPGSLGRGDEP